MVNLPNKNHFLIYGFLWVVWILLWATVPSNIMIRKYRSWREKVLGASIATIGKDTLIFPVNKELTYFYEPKPSTVITDHPEWLNKPVRYYHNADSLHERDNYQIEKLPRTFRIITLGDSFTYGHFVDTVDNWTEQLEKMLNREPCGEYSSFEVINLGVPGYDIAYTVHRYITRGEKYHPDLVIWLEIGTGFNRLHEITKPIIDECEATLDPSEKTTDDLYYCWNESERKLHGTYTDEQLLGQFATYYEKFFQTSKDIPVILTVFSDVNPVFKNFLGSLRAKNVRLIYNEIPSTRGVKAYSLFDSHPNRFGHKMIAESIYSNLKQNFLSCQ